MFATTRDGTKGRAGMELIDKDSQCSDNAYSEELAKKHRSLEKGDLVVKGVNENGSSS